MEHKHGSGSFPGQDRVHSSVGNRLPEHPVPTGTPVQFLDLYLREVLGTSMRN